MCFKTSPVKRFGDVYTPQYSFVHFSLSYFRHVFTEETATGGGAAAPPRKPAPGHMLISSVLWPTRLSTLRAYLGTTRFRLL